MDSTISFSFPSPFVGAAVSVARGVGFVKKYGQHKGMICVDNELFWCGEG